MADPLRFQRLRGEELPVEKAFHIATLLFEVWPWDNADLLETAEGIARKHGADPRRECCLLWEGEERVVAHARTFPRLIKWEGGEREILALAGVCVDPTRRGAGYGARVVRESFARIKEGEFNLSLFQTGVPEFYEKLGARRVENRFVNRQCKDPEANPWWDEFVMIYPAQADWPECTIDLNGAGY